jgi:hypothetical protein
VKRTIQVCELSWIASPFGFAGDGAAGFPVIHFCLFEEWEDFLLIHKIMLRTV